MSDIRSSQAGNQPAIADKPLRPVNGFLMLFAGLGLLAYFSWLCAMQFAEAGTSRFAPLNLGMDIAGIIASFIVSVAARRLVVKGAVSIVEEVLGDLAKANIGAPLDAEKRASDDLETAFRACGRPRSHPRYQYGHAEPGGLKNSRSAPR